MIFRGDARPAFAAIARTENSFERARNQNVRIGIGLRQRAHRLPFQPQRAPIPRTVLAHINSAAGLWVERPQGGINAPRRTRVNEDAGNHAVRARACAAQQLP